MEKKTEFLGNLSLLVDLSRCAMVAHSNGMLKGDCKATCQGDIEKNICLACGLMFNDRIISPKRAADVKIIQLMILNLVLLNYHVHMSPDIFTVIYYLIKFGTTNDTSYLNQIYSFLYTNNRLNLRDVGITSKRARIVRRPLDRILYSRSQKVFITHGLQYDTARREVRTFTDALKLLVKKVPYMIFPNGNTKDIIYNVFLISLYCIFLYGHFSYQIDIAHDVYGVL